MEQEYNDTILFVKDLIKLSIDNEKQYKPLNSDFQIVYGLFKKSQNNNYRYVCKREVIHLHEEPFPIDLTSQQELLSLDIVVTLYDMVSTLTKEFVNGMEIDNILNSMVFAVDLRINYFNNLDADNKINIDTIHRIGYSYWNNDVFTYDFDNQRIIGEYGMSLIELLNNFMIQMIDPLNEDTFVKSKIEYSINNLYSQYFETNT